MTLQKLTVTQDAALATTGGNVGIGTAGPQVGFDVIQPEVWFRTTASNWYGIDFKPSSSGNQIFSNYTGSGSDQPLILGTYANKGNQLFLATSGNVGIGTTLPLGLLQVGTSPNAPLVVTGAGYIGIGTVSPASTKLTVFGTDGVPANGGTTAAGHVRFVANGNIAMDIGSINAVPYPAWIQVHDSTIQSTNYPLALQVNGGNVGIGTTNPGARLEINGGHLLVQNGKLGIGVIPGASSESLEVSGSIKLSGRIRQGALGDLAEMMPLSSCILNPARAILDAPEALIKGNNDKTSLILKNKEEYRKYVLSQPEPADVVVINGEDGGIMRSREPFATNVVGIISTNPAQVLRDGLKNSVPVVLSGIVPCKVTAENGQIKPGDLLVSSSTPGHAMKAGKNPPQGTVIGKALTKLEGDVGVVDVIVMMQ